MSREEEKYKGTYFQICIKTIAILDNGKVEMIKDVQLN